MSASGFKEILSFIGIALLIISIALITFSRHKLTGILGRVISFIAFICLFTGAIIVLFIVFSGPTV